ncbi:MAG: hypothetical protein JW812_02220 [Alphaproteobacteria bacterium]|nr:hypothetical protein [Alphaproteobacteria bacterium]MBN2779583.1 hypothetical protein [Alphaproteobacteria bacterium]
MKITNRVNERKYKRVRLFAWKEDPKNIPFYQKCGFKLIDFAMELKTEEDK